MPSRRTLGRLVGAAALSCLITAGSAFAGGSSTDPDDTFGPLDVRSMTEATAPGQQLYHSVTMWPKWSNSAVRAKLNYIRLGFNLDADRVVERHLEIHVYQGSLFAAMTCDCGGKDKLIGYAKVWRPDEHTVAVEFPKSMLGAKIHRYRWAVWTRFASPNNQNCFQGGDVVAACYDRAPNTGWLVHEF